MISTTAPTISSTGITAPSFSEIRDFLVAKYAAIFGADVYLGDDSMDGQFISILAAAINDTNSTAIAIYNAFSPATAQGANLSSIVKINGIARSVSSASTVDVLITGQAGTTISNGIVRDAANHNWLLPASIVVPPAGSTTATATCATQGSVLCAAGTLTQIITPTRGWQSVINPSAADPGNPVEPDAALRTRQATSVSLPALSVLEGVVGAVSAVNGVDRIASYENDTASTDANGLPPHSIALVVEGGDATAIAGAIARRKTPGTGTFGSTSVTVPDVYDTPRLIKFSRPANVPISVAITLRALPLYTTTIGDQIKAAVANYISDLAIGAKVRLTRLYLPANLNGSAESATFEVLTMTLNGSAADVDIAWNAAASCTPSSVVITVQ